jgi:hypothetical protein
MTYKDKAEGYRGGRVNPDSDAPKRLRYPCFATGCPMPGTIGTGPADQPGTCAWHYGVLPTDIPKVTQRLKDWQCLTAEVNAARQALTGEHASDPKALDDVLAAAWTRLQPVVAHTGWEDVLKPRPGEHLSEWSRHIERFLGARVVEVLSTNQRRAA